MALKDILKSNDDLLITDIMEQDLITVNVDDDKDDDDDDDIDEEDSGR